MSSNPRFVVVDSDDKRVPEHERSDFGWHLIDTITNEWVGCDGGEPEDQLLIRDWAWVADAMNRYDGLYRAHIEALKTEIEQLKIDLEGAHIRNMREQDDNSAGRSALFKEIQRLKDNGWDEKRRSWAELVVGAVTEELAKHVEIPPIDGEGLEPADYVLLIQQLVKGKS